MLSVDQEMVFASEALSLLVSDSSALTEKYRRLGPLPLARIALDSTSAFRFLCTVRRDSSGNCSTNSDTDMPLLPDSTMIFAIFGFFTAQPSCGAIIGGGRRNNGAIQVE